MMFTKSVVLAIAATSAWTFSVVNGFVVPSCPSTTTVATATSRSIASSALFSSSDTTTTEENDLGLTPELKRVVDAFAAIGDEQVRYKQLLYMAQTTPEANSLPESSKIPANKVPGCLSTVYVDGTTSYNDELQEYVIDFKGDSDGLLTKGLVALLVRCLSGNTCESIQKVDPQFIKVAKIEQSLTPGRNNGFLNMLKTMKDKAQQLDAEARASSSSSPEQTEAAAEVTETDDDTPVSSTESTGDVEGGPKYNAMLEALQKLQPTSLELVDNSHQHAGHAGNDAKDGESHFDLSIVADAFDGLNLVKRHQLIYMVLGDIMPTIHALQISVALTPAEAKERGLTS
mmetsp:Transcript_24527/g.58193  ORF Transcript_24527/g.58193 Transcript_24527/m.58193 type:complete len:344 (+) Transcript_24527:83-1114(+)|eukprot:CAMPEP_0113453180 /NCGR_PEP_ID=MMETSP0014_2-20120614/7227_1 /TAXON_ID=2857 /ORGANISM="Nitzschia sp." /LENGTH=343 /DNA_ID=CAMNT_0000344571 /DNA_START=64 /DNA_END=1095 /DNA_ORIENTATION=+ /assembly_acc=CAM_ASM_000159